MVSSDTVTKPVRAIGGFYAMTLDIFMLMFKPPFAWREFLLQTWFVARVSIIPTLMLAIPFTVLVVFTLNILLVEFGAADFSGTGAATAAVTQIGPVVTVLVVAGTGATAMCAVAQMSLGTGALAVIGGTVVIVGFLTLSTGAVIAVQGYNQLSGIGVEAMTGFISAYVNVRIISPAVAGVGLAATIGAGTTAQLGAMRIADEIDALEVMAVRSMSYLVATRVVAGVVVVIPLYCVAVVCAFQAARFGTTRIYGQSTGVYDHYFATFLNSTDLLWSFFTVIVTAVAVMLVHTHYGYNAKGGPVGVGEAVGHSVRTSLIVLVLIVLGISLSVYGQSGHFNLSG